MAVDKKIQVELEVIPAENRKVKAALDDLGGKLSGKGAKALDDIREKFRKARQDVGDLKTRLAGLDARGGDGASAGGHIPYSLSRMLVGPRQEKLGGDGAALAPVYKATSKRAADPVADASNLVAGGFRSIAKKAITAIGPIGVAFGALGVAALAATASIGFVVRSIAKLVALASPAVANQFDYAINDTLAVIGHALIPVIRLFTDAIRTLGDYLVAILPSQKQVSEGISTLKEALITAAPYIKFVAKTFLGVVLGMQQTQILLGSLDAYFKSLKVTPGSSIGAAGNPASFVGVEEYGRRAALSAFSQGRDPNQETADNTKKLVELAEKDKAKGDGEVGREGADLALEANRR